MGREIKPNGWHSAPLVNTIPETPVSWYELVEPMDIYWRETMYRIPAGFKWNAASVPWFLWWIVPPTGLVLMSTAPHDYGYQNHGMFFIPCQYREMHYLMPRQLTREETDAMLRDVYRHDVEGWIASDRPRWVRKMIETARPWITWAGVRLFGWSRWSR